MASSQQVVGTRVAAWARAGAAVLALGAGLAGRPSRAAAQLDFYNTDAGRPLQIEDASALEYRALELQAAPFRLERGRGGIYNFGIEPKLDVGLWPRTQVAIGVPIAYIDAGAGRRTTGLAGIDLSVLHNLNAETAIPALATGGDVLFPAGALAPGHAYPAVKGIAPKSFRLARVHVNAPYTVGSRRAASDASGGRAGPLAQELSRWVAGAAVDHTLPLQSLLVAGEVYARQPLRLGRAVEYNAAVGSRFQLTPRTAVDGGVGRRLTGRDQGWCITFGSAYAFGLPWHH